MPTKRFYKIRTLNGSFIIPLHYRKEHKEKFQATLKIIDKTKKKHPTTFREVIKMKESSWLWFKFKCLRNPSGRCYKTFFRSEFIPCAIHHTTFWDMRKEEEIGNIANIYTTLDRSYSKLSVKYDVINDILYSGGSKCKSAATQILISS